MAVRRIEVNSNQLYYVRKLVEKIEPYAATLEKPIRCQFCGNPPYINHSPLCPYVITKDMLDEAGC